MITLRQIEVFLAVAEHEHVGRAARALNLSASATSSALASLERTIGHPLLDRSGRGLRLNAEGRRFRGPAAETLRRARELSDYLQPDRAGLLVVGASTTIANHLLAPALARFANLVPRAELRLDVGNTKVMRDRLLEHAVDLAYVEGPVVHPGLVATAWRADELVVFTTPDHPLAAVRAVRIADLEAHTWFLREDGSGTRETFLRAIGDDAARLRHVVGMGTSEAVARAVAAIGGVGCLSRLVVEAELRRGKLVALETPEGWELGRTLWRLQRRATTGGWLLAAFEDHLESDGGVASSSSV